MFARQAVNGARRGVRQMSSHGNPQQVFAEKEMWLKTTAFMGGAIIIPYTIFVMGKELSHMAHGHHEEHVTYPHMHVRRKAFPWVRLGTGAPSHARPPGLWGAKGVRSTSQRTALYAHALPTPTRTCAGGKPVRFLRHECVGVGASPLASTCVGR